MRDCGDICPQDKLESFWKIARAEVGELQAGLRNKDREAEEAEDRHQIEIKVGARPSSSPHGPAAVEVHSSDCARPDFFV